jgi:hypothetical protein
VARLLSNENGWSRALLPLLVPGCLVSFNDYPLGDIEGGAGASSGGRGGAQSGSPTAGAQNEAGAGGEPGGASGMLGAGENLIDDFQDGNPAILEHQGRKGAWYVANDGTGTQTPRVDEPLLPSVLSPPRGSSTRAIHTFGGPFATWGALIGTSLAMAGARGAEYDLSGFQGMRLWVRRGSMLAGSAHSVRLNLPTPATNSGGTCTVCNDHFGFDVPLTPQWGQVEVPFSSLKQQGYGRPVLAEPDLRHVTSLQLGFDRNVVFDLWVDDIELY